MPHMVDPIQQFLDRLDGVHKSGNGYRARCPACGGRSRKISLRADKDGRVLLHCFGGCAAIEVVRALGLQLRDLFDRPFCANTPEERRARRRAWDASHWGAALDMLELESTIVLLAARQLCSGELLSGEDLIRLNQAQQRIEDARRELRGH